MGDVIARLCTGEYEDARTALEHLYQHASRRVAYGNDPRRKPVAVARVAAPPQPTRAAAPVRATLAGHSRARPVNDQILPPSRKHGGLFGRIVGKLLGR